MEKNIFLQTTLIFLLLLIILILGLSLSNEQKLLSSLCHQNAIEHLNLKNLDKERLANGYQPDEYSGFYTLENVNYNNGKCYSLIWISNYTTLKYQHLSIFDIYKNTKIAHLNIYYKNYNPPEQPGEPNYDLALYSHFSDKYLEAFNIAFDINNFDQNSSKSLSDFK